MRSQRLWAYCASQTNAANKQYGKLESPHLTSHRPLQHDHEHEPLTVKFEQDGVMVNQHTKSLGQRSFYLKVIVWTHIKHTLYRLLDPTTKVAVNYNDKNRRFQKSATHNYLNYFQTCQTNDTVRSVAVTGKWTLEVKLAKFLADREFSASCLSFSFQLSNSGLLIHGAISGFPNLTFPFWSIPHPNFNLWPWPWNTTQKGSRLTITPNI